ncbi:hypothetical protein ACFFRL_12000 [Agromyces hippuratus]
MCPSSWWTVARSRSFPSVTRARPFTFAAPIVAADEGSTGRHPSGR